MIHFMVIFFFKLDGLQFNIGVKFIIMQFQNFNIAFRIELAVRKDKSFFLLGFSFIGCHVENGLKKEYFSNSKPP